MDPEGILTTTAEVAITVAGFSGVIVALGPRARDAWPAGSRIMLPTLLLSTGSIVGFSFLPLLMLATLEPARVWPIASGVHALYLCAASSLRFRQMRSETLPGSMSARWRLLVGPLLFAASLLIQGANLLFFRTAWPYLTAMVVSTLGAFAVFAMLLMWFWTEEGKA